MNVKYNIEMEFVDKLKLLSPCWKLINSRNKCTCFECSERTVFNMLNPEINNSLTLSKDELLMFHTISTLKEITLFNIEVGNFDFIKNTNITKVTLHNFGELSLGITFAPELCQIDEETEICKGYCSNCQTEYCLDFLALHNGKVIKSQNKNEKRMIELYKAKKIEFVNIIWDAGIKLSKLLSWVESIFLKRVCSNLARDYDLFLFPLLTDFSCIDTVINGDGIGYSFCDVGEKRYEEWLNTNVTAKKDWGLEYRPQINKKVSY